MTCGGNCTTIKIEGHFNCLTKTNCEMSAKEINLTKHEGNVHLNFLKVHTQIRLFYLDKKLTYPVGVAFSSVSRDGNHVG